MVAVLRAFTATAPLAFVFTGLVLVFTGLFQTRPDQSQAGWGFVTAGMALQATYLLTRNAT